MRSPPAGIGEETLAAASGTACFRWYNVRDFSHASGRYDMTPSQPIFDAAESRQIWQAAHWNGVLWALGNGFVSATVLIYFAMDLGAKGAHIGLILAMPQLFGVFRLIAPWLLDRNPDRKNLAIASFALSGILLTLIPLLARPAFWGSSQPALVSLLVLWGGWHVCMYLALVPFYSWLGDAGSGSERVKQLAWRELAMLIATVVGNLGAAQVIGFLRVIPSPGAKPDFGVAYMVCLLIGAGGILFSIVPLLLPVHRPRATQGAHVAAAELLALLGDRRYWPLLAFNAWFSFANGISISAVGMYPKSFLGVSADSMLYLQSGMRVAQAATSPAAGSWINASGHRLPMIVSQLLVSVGLLFYVVASREQPWWIAGASVCWVAYVVLNIGLPSLMLRLSPGESSPQYVAVSMAVSGVSFAVASLLGGWLLDSGSLQPLNDLLWGTLLPGWLPSATTTSDKLASTLTIFVIGFLLRLGSGVWLYRLREPEGEMKL